MLNTFRIIAADIDRLTCAVTANKHIFEGWRSSVVCWQRGLFVFVFVCVQFVPLQFPVGNLLIVPKKDFLKKISH